MKRTDVYKIIDTERAYQDRKWGPENDRHNCLADWLSYIEDYAVKAHEQNFEEARETLRKIAALSVAALEHVGAHPRRLPQEKPYDPCGGTGHIDVMGETFICSYCDARAHKHEDNSSNSV